MSSGGAAFKVLVVEDEPLIGMDIECAIERLGFEVVGPIAEVGEALDMAADGTLGCAILDVNILGGTSYPVADILLARGVPVLFLSGYNKLTFPERFQEETRLAKPYTAAELDMELRHLCVRAMMSERALALKQMRDAIGVESNVVSILPPPSVG